MFYLVDVVERVIVDQYESLKDAFQEAQALGICGDLAILDSNKKLVGYCEEGLEYLQSKII